MAGRAPSAPVKSPVNVAVGLLLRRLRERAKREVDRAAPALDVSPAYLAAIEAGTNALPAKAVVGLVALGLDFLAASALLAMVSYLDCRQRNSRLYNLPVMQLRAEGLLATQAALAFHPFLEWVTAALHPAGSGARGTATDVERGVRLLELGLGALSNLQPPGTLYEQKDDGSDPGLPPMVQDIVDVLSTSLSLITPHISRFKFKAWEEMNAARMFEVRAYVNDVEKLLEDAPEFDWAAMLLNQNRPPLTIFVPHGASGTEEEMARRFYDQLPLFNRSQAQLAGVREQIRIVKVDAKTLQGDVARRLVYDFSMGQLVQQEVWNETGKRILNQKRYYQFDNVWLYELRQYLGDAASHKKKHVAILGAYNEKELSSFGVFLNAKDSRDWWHLTQTLIG
jgi:hypothetical protein